MLGESIGDNNFWLTFFYVKLNDPPKIVYRSTNAKNLLDVLSDEVIAEKIGLPLEKVQEIREAEK